VERSDSDSGDETSGPKMPTETFKTPQLPDKFYFKIGEVSALTGLPAHVLRFWEGEFKAIQPRRTPSGQRLYRKNDVLMVFKIKHLLHEKKFTIEGARQYLKRARPQGDAATVDTPGSVLREIRAGLEEIRNLLRD
jgi:DNA-binding transcriptional MerR regulator